MTKPILVALALLTSAGTFAQPTLSLIPNEQMRMDLANSSVVANGSEWDVTLYMENDNDEPDGALPSGFRRWWNVAIGDLDPAGETLNVEVTHTQYTDEITPVWSLDGGVTWTRVPGATDNSSGTDHFFTVNTPPGITSIRLSKYYPYTLTMYDAWRAPLAAHPFVTVEDIGDTVQGRDIWMYEITNPSVADTNKQRVWIHCAVHCAETTAYFTAEGLVDWLTGNSYEANTLLKNVIVNIVPMANPDGVALGNYRTNANSVNLEIQWSAPYDSTVPEIVAMRSKIEEYMGTPGSPGANPIRALLNIHASHGLSAPFHFVHAGTYPPQGVISDVRTLELKWVNAFKGRSAFVDAGSNQSSTLGSRPYVEAMMHDRYTIAGVPEWTPVMAITYEGTYEYFPGRSGPSTDDDYRQAGEEMGFALADFFDVDITNTGLGEWWALE